MCGIAGASFKESAMPRIVEAAGDMKAVISILASDIETRGRDATGIAWYSEDANVWFSKRPQKAARFIRKTLNRIEQPIGGTFIVHTRLATQGRPENNKNNHPFICGNVIGVHNGVVWNDDWLTKIHSLPRVAETDSEVIFAMLNKFGAENMEPLEELEASMALAYLDNFNSEKPLYLAKGASDLSPLNLIVSDEGVLFSSYAHSINLVAGLLELNNPILYEAKDGYWAKVIDGVVVEENKFEPTEGNWYYCYQSAGSTYKDQAKPNEAKPDEAKPELVKSKYTDWSKRFDWEEDDDDQGKWWNHPNWCSCKMCVQYDVKKTEISELINEHPSMSGKLLEFPQKEEAGKYPGLNNVGAAMQRAIEDSAECLDCGVEKVYCGCGGGEG